MCKTAELGSFFGCNYLPTEKANFQFQSCVGFVRVCIQGCASVCCVSRDVHLYAVRSGMCICMPCVQGCASVCHAFRDVHLYAVRSGMCICMPCVQGCASVCCASMCCASRDVHLYVCATSMCCVSRDVHICSCTCTKTIVCSVHCPRCTSSCRAQSTMLYIVTA